MLVRRNRLRKKGRIEANRLAEKTNISIQDNPSKHHHKLAQASPKELWAAVKTTNGTVTQGQYDVESVNNFFVSVFYDPTYSVSNVTCFNPYNLNNNNNDIFLKN